MAKHIKDKKKGHKTMVMVDICGEIKATICFWLGEWPGRKHFSSCSCNGMILSREFSVYREADI
ncbi:hypothetical protein FRX31_011708 [Thalictrum thalictroides]|uniref:Uncharacterized protein n=1 Tax=Thalictrum thalictroides TaxID=46969 RepID=A0A7J6WMV8_THATH|nr:hypothetical protein FRX31_011708 [Thalictrum thalictroides]